MKRANGEEQFGDYRVVVVESEAGWGSRIDEVLYFSEKPEADAYVNQINSNNTSTVVPDWYMYAEYDGRVE